MTPLVENITAELVAAKVTVPSATVGDAPLLTTLTALDPPLKVNPEEKV
jgi:hypothetical protein